MPFRPSRSEHRYRGFKFSVQTAWASLANLEYTILRTNTEVARRACALQLLVSRWGLEQAGAGAKMAPVLMGVAESAAIELTAAETKLLRRKRPWLDRDRRRVYPRWESLGMWRYKHIPPVHPMPYFASPSAIYILNAHRAVTHDPYTRHAAVGSAGGRGGDACHGHGVCARAHLPGVWAPAGGRPQLCVLCLCPLHPATA